MDQPVRKASSVKLAWAVCWSAFWTGLPFKLIAAVLLLAMQVPPWEGSGLVTLLVIAIPVDIWALGLTARTYFLERFALELPGAVGITLWWQGAVVGLLLLGAGYYIVGGTVSFGKQAAAGIIDVLKRLFTNLPIAEQITLELLLWSVPTVLVSLILVLIALKLFGWRLKAVVSSIGQPSDASYPERVRRWDWARVPKDPTLMFASLASVVVLLTTAFWFFLPVTTPTPHQDFQPVVSKPKKPLKPEELLKQTETSLAKAEAVLQVLEKEKDGKPKGGKKAERKRK
jgi:hypothetical protein